MAAGGKAVAVRRRAGPGDRRRRRELAPDGSSPVRGGRASALAEVPGLLAVGDLPQIASLIAPRPCLLRVPDTGPYDWTRAAYRALGSDGLTVSEAKPH